MTELEKNKALVADLQRTLAERDAEVERLRATLVHVTNPDGSPNLQAEQVGAAESYRAAAIHAIEQREAAERAREEARTLLTKINRFGVLGLALEEEINAFLAASGGS